MAVSGRTQQGMYGDHADGTPAFFKTKAEARTYQEEMRATGLYRRVEVRQFNNGSRQNKLIVYMVLVWRKK